MWLYRKYLIMKNKKVGFISLLGLKGIGSSSVKKIINKDIFLTEDFYLETEKVLKLLKKTFQKEEIESSITKAKEIINYCQKEGISIISITDEEYPILLRDLKDAPPILYCKGNLGLLNTNIIGIIGTRKPSDTGAKIAERLGMYFSNNGWTICNGIVEGIDNYSIRCNESIHCNVIGVLAGGIDYRKNKTILQKTAKNADILLEKGGVIVSEIEPGIKESTFSIIKSCRIQAGLSKGLLLVQSPLDGGSKFATRYFCELPRPYGVINPIPKEINIPEYEANKEIITNKKKGISLFSEIKKDKIASDIFIINTKNDYETYVNLMLKNSVNDNLFTL